MGLPFQRFKSIMAERHGSKKLRAPTFNPEYKAKKVIWNGIKLLIS